MRLHLISVKRFGALAALLLIAASACGAVPANTVNARSSRSQEGTTTEPSGQATAAFSYIGVAQDGELRQFTNGSWQPLTLHNGNDLTFANVSWDGNPAQQPLIAVKVANNQCNFEWHFLRDNSTLSATVATGTEVSLSPDGNRLAVISQSKSPEIAGPCGQQTLGVVDLKTGQTRSWSATFPFRGYNESGIVGKPAWAPDSIHLAYGTDNSYLFLLDTRKAGTDATIRDAHLIRGHQIGLQTPAWNMDDGRLYVGTVQPEGYSWDRVRTTDGKVMASGGHPSGTGIPLRTRSYDGTFDFIGYVRKDDHLVPAGTPQTIATVKDGAVVTRVNVPADFIGVS